MRLETLYNEENQYFARQSWAVLEGEEDEFENLLLHRRSQELTTTSPDRRPQVRAQLLRVLMP